MGFHQVFVADFFEKIDDFFVDDVVVIPFLIIQIADGFGKIDRGVGQRFYYWNHSLFSFGVEKHKDQHPDQENVPSPFQCGLAQNITHWRVGNHFSGLVFDVPKHFSFGDVGQDFFGIFVVIAFQ